MKPADIIFDITFTTIIFQYYFIITDITIIVNLLFQFYHFISLITIKLILCPSCINLYLIDLNNNLVFMI